jgi:RNA polymerase sigma factor for flagellar operon FliA
MDTQRIGRIWKWYKRRPSSRVREAIIEHYYSLLVREAQKLHRKLPASVVVGDLISDGSLGMLDAIEAFEPGKAKFETFGRRRIVGAMLDGLRSRDDVSRSLRTTARKLDAAVESLRNMTGGEPTPQQVAAFLHMPLEKYLHKEQQTRRSNVRSLSDLGVSRHGRERGPSIDSVASSRQLDPRAYVDREAVKEVVMKGLTRAERLIVVLYYYEAMSMKQIGQVLELSEARICQMHQSLLARLKARISPDQLRV